MAVIHTIFIRVHNLIAKMLCKLNPCICQKDEEVFQATRRIVIAIYQHIHNDEWLPLMIGEDAATRRGTSCTSGHKSCWAKYNSSIDPSSMSEFSHSALRVFHRNLPSTTNEYNCGARHKDYFTSS